MLKFGKNSQIWEFFHFIRAFHLNFRQNIAVSLHVLYRTSKSIDL